MVKKIRVYVKGRYLSELSLLWERWEGGRGDYLRFLELGLLREHKKEKVNLKIVFGEKKKYFFIENKLKTCVFPTR